MITASISTWFGQWLHHFHGPPAYLLCGLLVFGEAALLLGFVIPGETAALVGGALAALHNVDVWVMGAVIVGAAIAGDSVGYEVGKIFGPWLVAHRPLRGHAGVTKAQELVVRFGGPAVFLGRWVALARALVPGVTGMSGMSYRTFLIFNAIGGLAWGTTFVAIGYLAGKSYEKVASTFGTVSLVAVAGVVVAFVVARIVLRRRRRRAAAELAEPG